MIQAEWLTSKACAKISSFEKKPENGGIPAIAIVPINIVIHVIGKCFFKPPILRISCSPPIAWITLPAPKNNNALKNAWVITWKNAPVKAPTPKPKNIYPN
ncbi:hypothetical protein D3C79_1003610 [compost metagenome]